jgi:DNA-directed RNA polymerase subunit K/omega
MTKLSSLFTPSGANKYEIAIVAAREARRLNEWAKRTNEVMTGKVTALALERTIRGEVPYGYEENPR